MPRPAASALRGQRIQRKVVTFGAAGRPDFDTEQPDPVERLEAMGNDPAALREVCRQLEELPRRTISEEQVLHRARALLRADAPSDAPTPDPAVWSGLPDYLKMEIILRAADTKELLEARTISKYAKGFVDRRAEEMVPYPDEILFRLVNASAVPDVFAKGNFTKEAMGKQENLATSWKQYHRTAEGKSAQALVMRIFETEAMRRASKSDTDALEDEQVIFRPVIAGKWTPQIDDAWILGHVHHRHRILIVCDPRVRSNFFDEKAQRLTATGREIHLALGSGYQCLVNSGTIAGVKGGLLLQPPNRIIPRHLLPTTLTPADVTRLLGVVAKFPDGPPLEARGEPFGPKVAAEIQRRFDQQVHDATKNLDGLLMAFKDKATKPKEYAEAVERCLNLLTPDSHIIRYDDQARFRERLRDYARSDGYLRRLGVKGRKQADVTAERAELDKVMVTLFERARVRTERA